MVRLHLAQIYKWKKQLKIGELTMEREVLSRGLRHLMPLPMGVTLALALLACTRSRGAPPAPHMSAPSVQEAQEVQHVRGTGNAVASEPAIAALVSFAISSFGPAGNAYSPPLAEWAPRRTLQLIRVECAEGAPATRRSREPIASEPGALPPQPPMVCRSGWRRKLGANLASSVSTFNSSNEQLARLRACFNVRERTAPRQLLGPLAGALFPHTAARTEPAHFDKALIAATNNTPTVYAVHSFTKFPVFEPCQVRGCEVDKSVRRKFLRFEEVEEFQFYAADGRGTRELFVPRRAREVSLSLLDDGMSPKLLAEARAGRWGAAQKLAAERVTQTRGGNTVAHGIALANLAVTLMFTRDRTQLRETIDVFRMLALPPGRADVAAAQQNIDHAREDVAGHVWLAVDPCAP